MSDAFNESPGGTREPRRDKPLTLAGIEPTQNLKTVSCHSHYAATSSSSTSTSSFMSSSSFTTHSSSCSASSSHSSSDSSCIVPTSVANVASPAPLSRIRARSRVCGSDGSDAREHSCDDVAGRSDRAGAVGSGNNEEFSTVGNDDSSRRQSLNFEDSSPSSQSFGKSFLGRTSRFPSGCGATTRKCVLTLDGYSYVIVASTPENRPTRDESIGISGHSGGGSGSCLTAVTSAANNSERRLTAVTGAANSTANEHNRNSLNCSPTSCGNFGAAAAFVSSSSCESGGSGGTTAAGGTSNSLTYAQAINGQVAKHGSLTIVRRSNSRKSFAQSEAQQHQNTISTAAAAATTTVCDSTTTTYNTGLLNIAAGTTTTSNTTPLLRGPNSCSTTGVASTPSSDNCTTSTTVTKAKDQNLRQFTTRMQIDSSTSSSNNTTTNSSSSNNVHDVTTNRMTPTTATDEDTETQASASGTLEGERVDADGGDDESAGTGNEPLTPTTAASVDLATENLPAVDTPDACDKAAVRLRCLLRLLNSGEISAEVLQKNLHYAARVLEAVFLDEAKSPAFNKSKSGQNSSSSVECEDQPEGDSCKNSGRCNGNCKNLNCSQHKHEHNQCTSSSSSNLQNNNNNNANSSCTLQQNDNQQQQLTSEMTSHNQSIAIESRTKGVSLAPQTHSGPTGPPDEDEPVTEESRRSAETATAEQTSTIAVQAAATESSSGAGGGGSKQDIGTSSSNSNKATVQRQRRLRTPVWARSMSTNKTYSCPKVVFVQL